MWLHYSHLLHFNDILKWNLSAGKAKKKEGTAYLQFERGYDLLQVTSREVLNPIYLLTGKLRVLWFWQPLGMLSAAVGSTQPSQQEATTEPSPHAEKWDLMGNHSFLGLLCNAVVFWFFPCTVVSFLHYRKALCAIDMNVVTCMTMSSLQLGIALPQLRYQELNNVLL